MLYWNLYNGASVYTLNGSLIKTDVVLKWEIILQIGIALWCLIKTDVVLKFRGAVLLLCLVSFNKNRCCIEIDTVLFALLIVYIRLIKTDVVLKLISSLGSSVVSLFNKNRCCIEIMLSCSFHSNQYLFNKNRCCIEIF